MRKAIIVGIVVLLFPMMSHATHENWFEKAREGYIYHIIERHRYSNFCDNIAQAGFTAAFARRSGENKRYAIEKTNEWRDTHHPLIEYGPYIDYAVDFAYQVQWSQQEVSRDIEIRCRRGEGIFENSLHNYQNGLIAPDPNDQEVLSFACNNAYGPKAYFIHHVMYEVGLDKEIIMERTVEPNDVMTTSIQREIVRQVHQTRPPSAEEARAQIQSDCMSRRGMFEIN